MLDLLDLLPIIGSENAPLESEFDMLFVDPFPVLSRRTYVQCVP